MKKTQDLCTQEEPRDWISRLARDRQVAKGVTCVKHVGELRGHNSWSTTGQNFQSDQAVSSQLVPITRLSHQNALFGWNMTFCIPHTPYYKYPYAHEM